MIQGKLTGTFGLKVYKKKQYNNTNDGTKEEELDQEHQKENKRTIKWKLKQEH